MWKLLIAIILTLTNCSTPPQLWIKIRPALTQSATLTLDSLTILIQTVSFNKKNVIDEKHSEIVKIMLLDTNKLRSKKKIDFQIDTSLVKCNYDFFSVWNRSDEQVAITGHIKIINWTQDEIKIREKIKVRDNTRDRTRRYYGARTFKKKK